MEFGGKVGKYSNKAGKNIQLKMDKMKVGKQLVQMLAKRSRSRLFDTSRRPVRGFKRLTV
jgi:uncharacterized Rossmann fold enzyme